HSDPELKIVSSAVRRVCERGFSRDEAGPGALHRGGGCTSGARGPPTAVGNWGGELCPAVFVRLEGGLRRRDASEGGREECREQDGATRRRQGRRPAVVG